MTEFEKEGPGRGLYIAALGLSALLFVAVCTRSLVWLVGVVPDDAFYYLQIARNIAKTGASTFDGINPTNGYHPAWMGILTLCAMVFKTPTALLRSCLCAAFALHMASSWLLLGAFRRSMSSLAAHVGAALWLLNPLPISLATQGMEASVYAFAMALTLWVYVNRVEPRLVELGSPGFGDLTLFGLCLSLCFLARTEAGILVVTTIVLMGLALRKAPQRGLRLAVAVAAFLFGISPWFVYSYWSTGTWMQGSGAMKMLWAQQANVGGFAQRSIAAGRYLFGQWLTYPFEEVVFGNWEAGVQRGLIGIFCTAALVWLLLRGLRRRETRRPAMVGSLLLATTLLTGAIYGFFFADGQYWYKAQAGFILFVELYYASAMLMAGSRWSASRASLASACAVLLAAAVSITRLATLDTYPYQRDVLASQTRFDRLVPVGEPIGCFNAGIPGFFSSHTVINLDGLVNNSVQRYYRSHQFDSYLVDQKIRFLADETWSLDRGLSFAAHSIPVQVLSQQRLTKSAAKWRYLWRVLVAGEQASAGDPVLEDLPAKRAP